MGILLYTGIAVFLVFMLFFTPQFYIDFVARYIERDTHAKFSDEGTDF
jgi:hypothetical protein